MALQTIKVDKAMRLRNKLIQMDRARDRVRNELTAAEQALNKQEAHLYGVRNGSINDKRHESVFIGRPKKHKTKEVQI